MDTPKKISREDLPHTKNAEPTLYKYSQFEHRLHELPPGKSYLRNCVGNHNSETMRGGWNFLNKVTIPWSLPIDEMLFILEGTLKMTVGDKTFVCEQGDILWVPGGDDVIYEAEEKVSVFYVTYPFDWKEQIGITSVPGKEADDVPPY